MKLLASLIFVFFLPFQTIDINSLRKDTTMVKYNKVTSELKKGLLEKRYNFPPNFMEIQKEFMSNPTKEFMKKRLKESGMTNADEYVDKIFLQTTLMFEFLKKHPEISKLDAKTKSDLFIKLVTD